MSAAALYRRFVVIGFSATLPGLLALLLAPGWFARILGIDATPPVECLLRLLSPMLAGIQVRTLLQARRARSLDADVRLRCLTGGVFDGMATLVLAGYTAAGALGALGWAAAASFGAMAVGYALFFFLSLQPRRSA